MFLKWLLPETDPIVDSSLWLNEAFATLMGEVIIINELHPEWGVHSEFINDHLGRALELDALRSSHPIEMPCPGKLLSKQILCCKLR